MQLSGNGPQMEFCKCILIMYGWNMGGYQMMNFIIYGNPNCLFFKMKIFLWLVRQNRILTKDNLLKKGWAGSSKCKFCDQDETVDHLFVTCPYITQIWVWIAKHNNFHFDCTNISDLWVLDAYIPFKNKPLVELIRGAVIWVIWLERNRVCFQNNTASPISSIAAKIVSLTSFWCKSRGDQMYLKLSLILPFDVKAVVPLMATGDTGGGLATRYGAEDIEEYG